MKKWYAELRQRNVIRVTVAYLVASWMLLQVADLVLDVVEAPAWILQVFVLFLALLLPLVIGFSWAFEVTPDGIKWDKDVDRSQSVPQDTGRRLDLLTIGLLVLAIVLLAISRLIPSHQVSAPAAGNADTATEQTVATALPTVPPKSLVVLAFRDLSPDGDHEYFADGISEEILSAVARFADIRVAGRASAFAFKQTDHSPRDIGELLRVAHILQGSVSRSGNRIRVTAQLVKAVDGFILFSQKYERELTDIFAVQDEIARRVAQEMRSTILGEQVLGASAETALPVYERYLQARQWLHSRNRSLMEQASVLLDEALAQDPVYAPALTQKALAVLLLSDAEGAYGNIPRTEALATAEPLLARAIDINRNHAEAWEVQGLLYMFTGPEYRDNAIGSLRRALKVNPDLANANTWLASVLDDQGEVRAAAASLQAVSAHNPLYAPAFINQLSFFKAAGLLDEARALLTRFERIGGSDLAALPARVGLHQAEGNLSMAVEAYEAALTIHSDNVSISSAFCPIAVQLGFLDKAVATCLYDFKLVPLALSGQHEAATQWLSTLESRRLSYRPLDRITSYFMITRDYRGLVDYLERRLPGTGELRARLPIPDGLLGVAPHAHVAYALRQIGRQNESTAVLAAAVDNSQRQLQQGANNLLYWDSAAQLAALQDDRASMLAGLRRKIDTGGFSVHGFHSPVFDAYREEPEFKALEEESRQRANAELVTLGLRKI